MRILFVNDHVFLTKNGVVYSNSFSLTILNRYVDVFSEITVLARCREVIDTGDTPIANGEGINFIFLDSISTFSSYFGLRQQHQKRIEKLVDSYDGVIVRLPSELGLMTADIANRMHKKYITEVVGCAWDAMWNYGGWVAKFYAPFLFIKMKVAVKKSSYVSYVTRQFLQNRYPPANHTISIGVSDVELPLVDKSILVQRLIKIEAQTTKTIFGTIGNLNLKYKGIEVAIKTLARSMNTDTDFEYHILGDGDPAEFKLLADRLGIGDKVFFDGTLVGGKGVFCWLDNIDVYLQPSLTEGLPRSLVEAMSRGCPAIGSSVGGIPELLDKKMIFSHKETKRFLDILRSFICNKQAMKNVAKQNFNKTRSYQSNVLDEKRKSFLMTFRDDIV